MHKIVYSIILLIIISTLVACGMPTRSDTLNVQVQTAIAQTAVAEATFQVAVDQVVEATVIAMPPTPTPQPTVDPYTLTEEELAALINASCEEVATAYTEASTAATQAASDGSFSDEEVYETIYYIYDAEAAIAYAEELLHIYYDLYGAYASEVLDLLYAVEDDLEELAYAITEIEAILLQGAETASAAIEQFNLALGSAQTKVAEIQAKAQEFKDKLPATLEERENRFANLAPTEIAGNREEAILQVYTYLDSVKAAFDDRKVSPDEMGQIAQLAANAKAGINQSGGPLLQGFSGNIDGITRNISRGDWPSAQRDLGGFETSFPARR